MTVRVLGDPPTVRALRLAGLEGRIVGDGESPEAAFEEMLEAEDLGVLLVTEPVAGRMRERIEREMAARTLPLVLEIPARGVEPEHVDELIARVARLVGMGA